MYVAAGGLPVCRCGRPSVPGAANSAVVLGWSSVNHQFSYTQDRTQGAVQSQEQSIALVPVASFGGQEPSENS